MLPGSNLGPGNLLFFAYLLIWVFFAFFFSIAGSTPAQAGFSRGIPMGGGEAKSFHDLPRGRSDGGREQKSCPVSVR